MSKLSSDQIATMFAERLTTGGYLTAKQTAWLKSVFLKEHPDYRLGTFPTMTGLLLNQDTGIGWGVYIMKNGAGNLKIR